MPSAIAQRANASGEIFSTLGDNQAVQEMRRQLAERKAEFLDDENTSGFDEQTCLKRLRQEKLFLEDEQHEEESHGT